VPARVRYPRRLRATHARAARAVPSPWPMRRCGPAPKVSASPRSGRQSTSIWAPSEPTRRSLHDHTSSTLTWPAGPSLRSATFSVCCTAQDPNVHHGEAMTCVWRIETAELTEKLTKVKAELAEEQRAEAALRLVVAEISMIEF